MNGLWDTFLVYPMVIWMGDRACRGSRWVKARSRISFLKEESEGVLSCHPGTVQSTAWICIWSKRLDNPPGPVAWAQSCDASAYPTESRDGGAWSLLMWKAKGVPLPRSAPSCPSLSLPLSAQIAKVFCCRFHPHLGADGCCFADIL